MLFNSIQYLVFFPAVFALYWLLPERFRRALLLVASYVFYMSWIPAYGFLILGMSAVNYALGLAIDRFRAHAKPLFVAGVLLNLATLCYFKYTNFLLASLTDVTAKASHVFTSVPQLHSSTLDVILPLGISFFAFEFIHYITDVYRGGRPIYGVIDFALFAAFFPSQIAGPIKRYQDFVAQLGKQCRFDPALFQQGVALFLQGLFKKVALADNLSTLANAGFAASQQCGTIDAWVAVLAFTLQIYCDFSGYTDMGRGSAMMLGFCLPDNFNFPYAARSVQDFWRRWHISLSTWLRDYLYIPLGGSRCSQWCKYRNLMITMLLGGLWHGAAWHFVVWGGYQGAGLVLNHKYDQLASRTPLLQRLHASRLMTAGCWLFTFMFVVTSWTFFRADTVTEAVRMFANMFTWRTSSVVVNLLPPSTLPAALAVYAIYACLFVCPGGAPQLGRLRERLIPGGVLARAVVGIGILFITLGFAPMKASPFIYFQF